MGKTKREKYTLRDDREDETIKSLKEVIIELNKRISQLEKELREVEYPRAEDEPLTHSLKLRCQECKSDTVAVPIGKFTLINCTKCNWRVRK